MKSKKQNNKKIDLEFIPFENLQKMTMKEKVKYIIKKTQENKILIFDSKLTPQEEVELISETMKFINNKFKGVEIASLYQNDDAGIINKIKGTIFRYLTGKNRGTSIIGPAKIIREIKRDPDRKSVV